MIMNKKLVAERYDNYGEDFEEHCRKVGGRLDYWVNHYLGKRIRPKTLLLDVAGGDGLATSLLDSDRVSIVLTDVARQLLRVAKQKRPNNILGIIHDFDEPFPFLDKTFDYVTCISALEFCYDLKVTLSEMMRVMKRDGLMLFTTDRLNKLSATQRDEIYIHDRRGFFSRRYSTEHVIEIINSIGGKVERVGLHKAYLLEQSWVMYNFFVVSKRISV